ncbi:unnamed protein product [Gongylonema pulchrum]|uniref:Slipin family protein n=1 Tax=Gongylonema pulchrum TaxID=637853 RepID=A0A183EI21_9BILA|nr:unnamed protein product [Gongylonema pulchrum]
MWLPNGSLRIIDRKNNLFKLAQADFVSPEQIENTYLQHPLVKQNAVRGLGFLFEIDNSVVQINQCDYFRFSCMGRPYVHT